VPVVGDADRIDVHLEVVFGLGWQPLELTTAADQPDAGVAVRASAGDLAHRRAVVGDRAQTYVGICSETAGGEVPDHGKPAREDGSFTDGVVAAEQVALLWHC
jgi:hypothetical protein